jgi:hypothetical protein
MVQHAQKLDAQRMHALGVEKHHEILPFTWGHAAR